VRRNNRQANNSLSHRPPLVRYTPDVFGFPDRLQTKLKYADTGVITSTTGAVGLQIFRINSTFDPDYTNVGHQPMYRDTYAAIYDQYAVVSVIGKITLMNVNTSNIITCGMVIDDDTTVSTSTSVLLEQNHGINSTLTPLSGSKSEWTFPFKWKCQEILNIDPYASQSYKTAVGSNPTESSILAIWSVSEDASSTTYCHWKVEFEMTVLWTELSTPTIS
jgi:hypothetical protein